MIQTSIHHSSVDPYRSDARGMFRVQGVSPPPLLIYRALIVCLLFCLLYSYHSHNQQISAVIESAKEELESCHANSESIFSKLKVIFEHKKKIETQMMVAKNDSDRRIAEMKRSLAGCHGELDVTKQKLATAMATTPTVTATTITTGWQERQRIIEELSTLKDEVDRLKKETEKEKKESEEIRRSLEETKRELEECRRTIRQHVGALPVDHYTQNETASFQRKHKAGEALSFDRGVIEEHHGEVIHPAELVRRLEEKKKKDGGEDEKDIHPDDRKEEDEYVNEKRDEKEKDYKEPPNDA